MNTWARRWQPGTGADRGSLVCIRTSVPEAPEVFGAPGADWLILGPQIEPRHTDYDVERAAAEIRASEYTDAVSFAATVVRPPTETEMAEKFTRVGIKR